MHFGVGRYLYSLEKEWVALKDGQIPPEEVKRLRGKLPRPESKGPKRESPEDKEDLKARLEKADEALGALIAELKEKGLGKEAAQVVLQSGYKIGQGETEADLEKARTLYKTLKALLG